LKRLSLRLFEDGRPNNNKNNNKMSGDMGSVPNPKKTFLRRIYVLSRLEQRRGGRGTKAR